MATTNNAKRSNASPYLLKPQQVDLLTQSDGFKILRDHLAHTYHYELCSEHRKDQSKILQRWLIVRDVLHALLVPIVELFDKAVNLAISTTDATVADELEHAFTGQARNAFLWLQCFLSSERERDWCYTRGCSVCVVEHSLDSEFSIQMVYAACLLSDVHYPFTLEGPKLPSFRFFLESLERASAADPRYGAEYFERMQLKAVTTRNGIEDLILQCVELEDDLDHSSSPSASFSDTTSITPSPHSSPVLAPLGPRASHEGSSVRLKLSRSKSREMSLQLGEEQWVDEMLKRCWEQMQPHEPADPMPDLAESLRGALKFEPAVSVTAISNAS